MACIKKFLEWTRRRMDNPKPICPSNFFEIGGIMILCVWTEMSGQDQTAHCSWRSSLIRIYTVCRSACIFWTHNSVVKPPRSHFRNITTIFFLVCEYWPYLIQVLAKVFMLYSMNKGTDQFAHPWSLISVLVIHLLDSIISMVAISRIRRVCGLLVCTYPKPDPVAQSVESAPGNWRSQVQSRAATYQS